MLQEICRTSPGFRSKRSVCTSFGSDCVSSTAPPGSFTSKGIREATCRLVKACLAPFQEFSRFWNSIVKEFVSSSRSTAAS